MIVAAMSPMILSLAPATPGGAAVVGVLHVTDVGPFRLLGLHLCETDIEPIEGLLHS